jgi:ABC-type uncharacterized transport system auxiliary subunit
MKNKYLILGSILLVGLFLAGCLSVKYPDRKQYMLDVPTPPVSKNRSTESIEINAVNIAQAFAGFEFVYRTTSENYTHDYYNIFFNQPTQQINTIISKYLAATKKFSYVSSNPGVIRTNKILYTDVMELYGDYRDPDYPQAVITVRFIMVSPEAKTHVSFDKTYHSEIPFASGNAASLVDAWDRGLESILNQLVKAI